MQSRRGILFLTLVLSCATSPLYFVSSSFAAKPGLPSIGDDDEPEARDESDKGRLRDTVDIVSPPETGAVLQRVEYFYPYRRALTFRAGAATRASSSTNEKSPTITGIQFLFTTQNLAKFEAGADLISDGNGALHAAQRWVFTRTKLRPYAKLGGGLIIDPKDMLAALAKYEMFVLEGASGFEYVIHKEHGVRLEAEALAGLKNFQFGAFAGYVWAW